MKKWSKAFSNIALLSQLGLSFVTPTLMCIGLCWWLNTSYNVGAWIYILGFFFGLGGSFTVAYRFYLATIKEHKKDDERPKSFNRHL